MENPYGSLREPRSAMQPSPHRIRLVHGIVGLALVVVGGGLCLVYAVLHPVPPTVLWMSRDWPHTARLAPDGAELERFDVTAIVDDGGPPWQRWASVPPDSMRTALARRFPFLAPKQQSWLYETGDAWKDRSPEGRWFRAVREDRLLDDPEMRAFYAELGEGRQEPGDRWRPGRRAPAGIR